MSGARRSGLWWGLAVAGAALVGLRLALGNTAAPPTAAFPHALTAIANPQPVPTPPLVGMDGRPFSLASLRGKWVWVYFGYTSCPDVCPAALGRLADAYHQLRARQAVKVLFVSVDPGRDTPARLGHLAGYFDRDFLAATGDRAALDTLTHALGASYALEPRRGAKGGYDVDHSNLVFVLDPAGRAVATYLPDAGADPLRQDFDALVASGRQAPASLR